MEEIVVGTLEKKELRSFEGSHANMQNSEENRKYELQAQPLFMFANYNELWEQDDFTDKYEQIKEVLGEKLQTYNQDIKRNKIDYILFDEAIRYLC